MDRVRRLAHAFLTTRDDHRRSAGLNLLRTKRNGAQTRTADLVDTPGRCIDRHSCADGSAASWSLALGRGENLPEDDFRHVAGLDIGALQSSLDDNRTEFMGRERGERAGERADGSARSTDNNDIGILAHKIGPPPGGCMSGFRDTSQRRL